MNNVTYKTFVLAFCTRLVFSLEELQKPPLAEILVSKVKKRCLFSSNIG